MSRGDLLFYSPGDVRQGYSLKPNVWRRIGMWLLGRR